MNPPPIKPDLQKLLHDVPHQPGVYLMRDRLGHIIYVGKAKDLRRRLSHYFTPSRKHTADLKTRALIHSIWSFEIHTVRTEAESLLLEAKLIKEYRPKYNVLFRDDKRFLMLRIHLEEPWPKFSLCRYRKEDGARYFGPFAHSSSLYTTLNFILRECGLRTCRPLRPGESDYRHCHNDVIQKCCAPCVGRVTREEYMVRVEKGCAILEGKEKEILTDLEKEMQDAAAALEFERAAALRDMLDDFRKTIEPARRFTRGRGLPRKSGQIDPMADVRQLQEELGLDRPPLVMECFDISNISTTHVVASMVRFKNGVADNQSYRRYRIKTVKGQNDFASMAEVVRRRYSRILLQGRDLLGRDEADFSQENPLEAMRRLEQAESAQKKPQTFVRLPDLVIVDGGPGQLSSAVEELQRLGLHDLPIIGLAKENEEIHRPNRPVLALPHEMGALRLLQRIRDEAHRVANGYHQLLLRRRVAESILDDCPGVSETRKRALLKAFGSVSRLRKASESEIGAVSGIGPRLAAEIVAFLRDH